MWIKINGNESYSVSENGEVRNDRTGQIKVQTINHQNGYAYVDLWENNIGKKYAVHRLVAETFLPNPEGKKTVDHIDGDRKNNKVSNLRWATYGENNSRFSQIGVRSQRVRVTHYPEIRKKRGGGHESWEEPDNVIEFDRISDVAEYFGVTIGNISLMLEKGTIGVRGKTRGFRFEYIDGVRFTYTANV